MVAILNENRQIVAANESLLAQLHAALGTVLSKRPGEAVGCIHAKEGPNGCGTARPCVACGTVNAILDSCATQQRAVRDCQMCAHMAAGVTAMNLRATATPFVLDQYRFIVLVLEDISHSNRLAVLQRVFFHDVLNTAACIQGYAQCLADGMAEGPDVCQRMVRLTDSLIESIQSQRDLVQAEAGDLQTRPVPVQASQVLDEIYAHFQAHALVAEGRAIKLRPVCDGTVVADRQLLLRVLGNMIKNALEATSPRRTVSIGCQEEDDKLVFTVHNAEVMPEEVQLQIFKRSFSTKAEAGRGIGTYSVWLLGERYLGGKVGFNSEPLVGTTFWLALPKRVEAVDPGKQPA
jgi:signal transduction histidine kinase